jgi:hypothetical protein
MWWTAIEEMLNESKRTPPRKSFHAEHPAKDSRANSAISSLKKVTATSSLDFIEEPSKSVSTMIVVI